MTPLLGWTMGGAIGEWSNSAPRAEPCHWATWVAPIFSEGNSLDSLEIRTPQNPTTKTFPLAPPTPPCLPLAQGPTAGRFQGPRHLRPWPLGLAPPGPPLAPPAPPGPPLARPGPPGCPWLPLAPPGQSMISCKIPRPFAQLLGSTARLVVVLPTAGIGS